MRLLYLIPSLESVYAARFIFEGLRNAFDDLGHEFRPFTADDDLKAVLDEYRPDIFFYSLNFYHLRFLDLDLLRQHREGGLTVFCQIRPWQAVPDSRQATGVPVAGLKDHKKEVGLITGGLAGDVFWHWFEQDEPLMVGFADVTGRSFETIHLAADKTLFFPEPDERFRCDLAFVGSYLPAKRDFLCENVLPLREDYDVRIFGHDWTRASRALGHIQRAGQFFNIRPLRSLRKFKLSLDDERRLYSSARISLNVHEQHQRRTGSDVNERTFKILACGGFQLCDDVALLRRLFSPEEVVVAQPGPDWYEKVEHYLRHPEERERIAANGRHHVLAEHTYHHRAQQVVELAQRSREART